MLSKMLLKRSSKRLLLVACSFVLVGGVLSDVIAETAGKLPGQINPIQPLGPVQAPVLPTLKAGDPLPENLFVELAKALNPATVNIFTTTAVSPRFNRRMPVDPFSELFEEFMNPGLPGGGMPPRQAQALGTGFIISSDGLIITNNHVVEGADQIKVNVQVDEKTEKSYEARVIGTDKRTDLALIKIDPAHTLTVAQLGSSKDLQVGEWVAAFGNPLGLGHTMTKGIISAKGRAIDELNRFPFLQTDASINPGNSGGPLVNTKGLVIGVNTAIAASGQGIGFAIPIDDAKPIIAQLQKNGSVKHGFLGVYLQDLTPYDARVLGLDAVEGAIVANVLPQGPADQAGLKVADILLKIGEKKIRNSNDVMIAVADAEVGATVPVAILRNGKAKTVSVVIRENPGQAKMRPRQAEERKQYAGQKAPLNLGFKMADMSEQMRRAFGINPQLGTHPVVIEIDPSSPASKSGLQSGDVILEANQENVKTSADLIRRLKSGQNSLRVARARGFAIIFLNAQ